MGKGISRGSVHFRGWRIPISGCFLCTKRLGFVYKIMLVVDVPVALYFFSFLPCLLKHFSLYKEINKLTSQGHRKINAKI